MAWTHEQVCVRQPAYRTAEMSTIDGERDELLVAFSAQPGSGPGGHARPRQRKANAMNCWSLSLRSQAAVLAVTPDQGRGEESRNDTRSEERRVGKEGRSRWSPY